MTSPRDPSKPSLMPRRPAYALARGALCGSAQLSALALIGMILPGVLQGGFTQALISGLILAALVFVFSLPVWATGLVVIGLPGWLALHALGWRSRFAGAAFGAMATFVTAFVLGRWLNPTSPGPFWDIAIYAGVLAMMGAVVGWVVAAEGYQEQEDAR